MEISTSCLEIDCEMIENVVSNHEGKLVVQEYWVQCFEPDEFRMEEFGLRNEQMMVGEEYCPIEAEQLDETQKRDIVVKRNMKLVKRLKFMEKTLRERKKLKKSCERRGHNDKNEEFEIS